MSQDVFVEWGSEEPDIGFFYPQNQYYRLGMHVSIEGPTYYCILLINSDNTSIAHIQINHIEFIILSKYHLNNQHIKARNYLIKLKNLDYELLEEPKGNHDEI